MDQGIPVELHEKFWGKSMKDEEEEWRNAQRGKEPVDDERMDVDDADAEPIDEADKAGCYMLDIGIEEFRVKKIWIRADYIRTFDCLVSHCEKRPKTKSPSAVVTGQPGIGEFLRCLVKWSLT